MIRMMTWMTTKALTPSERREGGLGAAAYPQPPLALDSDDSAFRPYFMLPISGGWEFGDSTNMPHV